MARKAISKFESNGINTLDVDIPLKLKLYLNGSLGLVRS
jgi:hypothetical protein